MEALLQIETDTIREFMLRAPIKFTSVRILSRSQGVKGGTGRGEDALTHSP